MADYYPLIARAVGGLEKNTGENRRALYERARSALVNQLRGVDPPLNESDITRERLALEESIRKVEAEAAKRAREVSESDDTRTSLRDQGLRDFRDTVKEAQGLGGATAEANRSAHATYDQVPDENSSFGKTEPKFEPPATPYSAPPVAPPSIFEPRPESHDAPPPEFSGEPKLGQDHAQDIAQDDHAQDVHAQDLHAQDLHAQDTPHERGSSELVQDSADQHARERADELAHELSERHGETSQEWHPPPPVAPHENDEDPAYARPARNFGRILKILLLLLVLGGIAGAGYWQRNAITSMIANFRSTSPAPKPVETAQPAGRPKIADRVGGESTPSNANAPAASVAQKVVLYDEDASDPQGKRYVGSALWRTETVSPGPGLAPELAIRADIEIPERRLRMTWSLRRNTDKALPASHTIEVLFTLPTDFAEGGIGNVPGILMKQNEQARGSPLAGLAVKVTNGYFLIGLSAVDVDVQRNIQLLKERDWFDIPVVYVSGKRAILAIEKGTPGARAFEEAFRAWGQ